MGSEAEALSSRLLERHLSLGAVLRAYADGDDPAFDVPPAARDVLSRLGAVLIHSVVDDAFDGPVMRSLAAVGEYLRQQMMDLRLEQFRVLHLDGDNRLLADRVMWTGTVDRVQVHVRELIRGVLDTGATALILAHNHPSGSLEPSAGDLQTTRSISRTCASLDVVLHDHIIVGRRGIFSMRAHNLIDDVSASHKSAAGGGR